MTEDYVVLLDKERDFCRLFRADAEEMPAGEVLWSGNGLRVGYDAMIRLNKERRPISAYSVCSAQSPRGRTVYRIVRGEPEGRWKALDQFFDFAAAKNAVKSLTKVRNEAEAAEKEKAYRIMRRVGIQSRRIPKFTETDRRYLAWLAEAGKFAA